IHVRNLLQSKSLYLTKPLQRIECREDSHENAWTKWRLRLWSRFSDLDAHQEQTHNARILLPRLHLAILALLCPHQVELHSHRKRILKWRKAFPRFRLVGYQGE